MKTQPPNRNRKRLITSLINAVRYFLLPLSQFVLAKIVIDQHDMEFWGQVVGITIYVQLGAIVAGWGVKDYSLREMSLAPKDEVERWNHIFWVRVPLLVLLILLLAITFSPHIALPVALWTLSIFLIQSLESRVLFTNRITFFGSAELVISSIYLLVAWYWRAQWVQVVDVIWLLTGVNAARAVFHVFIFRKNIRPKLLPTDLQHVRKAFPFFLLGFSGMMFSKVDLYVANAFLPAETLGRYQLFMSGLLQIQALSGLLLMPLVRNIYRLQRKQITQLTVKYFGLGILVSGLAIYLLYLLLSRVYHVHPDAKSFVIGLVFTSFMFLTVPIVHYLYGRKKERKVLILSIMGFLINLALSICWVQSHGFTGLILATTTAQLTVSSIYILLFQLDKQNE